MSRMPLLTDDAIRSALALDPTVRAPLDLGPGIRSAIGSTSQRSTPWLRNASPRVAFAVRLVVLGLLLIALLGAIALIGSRRPAPQVLPAVITYHGGPERTGVMPGPGPRGTLSACWPAFPLNGPVGSYAPVVANGTVYIGDANGSIDAVDELSGVKRWQTPTGPAINDAPAIAPNLVIAGYDDGIVRAWDAKTGLPGWTFKTGAQVRSSPAVVDGVLYFGSDDGHLYAIDAATGSVRWESPDTGGTIDRAVAVSAGVIYAGSGNPTDAKFDAYDAQTGQPRWAQPVHLGPGQPSTPTVVGTEVFVASGLDTSAGPHLLIALNAATGAEIWHWQSPAGVKQQVNIGAVANGIVYVVSYDHGVYALDAGTGASRWPAPFMTKAPIGAVAGFVDGTLYVPSSDRHLYLIDATSGAVMAPPFPLQGDPSGPAIIDGRLFLATTLGRLMCIAGS